MEDPHVGRLEERLQLVFYCSARDETDSSVLGNSEKRGGLRVAYLVFWEGMAYSLA